MFLPLKCQCGRLFNVASFRAGDAVNDTLQKEDVLEELPLKKDRSVPS